MMIFAVGMAILGNVPDVMGQTSDAGIIQQPAIQNKPGLHIEYDAWVSAGSLHQFVREDYVIDILETWKGGVTFRYTIQQSALGDSTGTQTLTSLDDCVSLDPWWEPDKVEFDDRCELWIPGKNLIELLVEHKTFLKVDRYARRDSNVRWEFQREVEYPCEINHQTVLLKAVLARTSRNDDIIILNDPEYPLILGIDSSYFKWRVARIRD